MRTMPDVMLLCISWCGSNDLVEVILVVDGNEVESDGSHHRLCDGLMVLVIDGLF
jgi:hypothetical protein